MEIKVFTGTAEPLRHIANAWEDDVLDNKFKIEVSADKLLIDLTRIANSEDSDLVVLYDEEPIGFIGIQYFDNPLGNQKMANENYFYVLPEKRGLSSIRLLKEAKKVAKSKGCSHFIMNASNLASDMHDKICKLYERLGMARFETAYIESLESEV